jgi:prepilin-type N-terminal cleavage/methylation domain-containing protein
VLKRSPLAFTLIELLIVVAIIAILAAIAVPNFLEAQTRSKVSRVKNDFRTFATALEAYLVDANNYPIGRLGKQGNTLENLSYLNLQDLTTPVAYLTSVNLPDPFVPKYKPTGSGGGMFAPYSYIYIAYNGLWGKLTNMGGYKGWNMHSYGPDRTQQYTEWIPQSITNPGSPTYAGTRSVSELYDPTNGTVSSGDIARFGGEIPLPAGVR